MQKLDSNGRGGPARALVMACVLSLASPFLPTPAPPNSLHARVLPRRHRLRESPNDVDSWSRPASETAGARSRVRSVLRRARTRTGRRNGSEPGSASDATAMAWDFPVVDAIGIRDALSGDTPAAFSMPASPLPFSLPELTEEQADGLLAGERIQFQQEMGLEGSGFVVVDVKAPARAVWDCLLDFHSYPDLIPTVRDVTMYTNTHLKEDYLHEEEVGYEDGRYAILKPGVPSVTRAAFTLSKFKLKIAVIHKYRPHPQGDYMVYNLDPANRNYVLKGAKGIWHTQSNPDGRGEEYTRVWLLAELSVSKLLPKFIVDYAAKKAMPRATTWLKPQVEAAASLWLKDCDL